MHRHLLKALLEWKDSPHRLPLLLRGARQVGKTYLVEYFGNNHFDDFMNINFELEPEYIECFNSFDPKDILQAIEFKSHRKIIPGKTLLFLDEIQDCPKAIQSLRYFKEKLSKLHVIGAGSLLEFVLNEEEIKMPVGRVQYMYLQPLSFREFLDVMKHDIFLEAIENGTLKQPINEIAHKELNKLVQQYIVLGGMPAAINAYQLDQDISAVQTIQNAILSTYRDDFGKYASKTDYKHLQAVFQEAPSLVGKQVKYVDISRDARSRELKHAISLLQKAGLLYQIFSSQASGLPLNALIDEKKFKMAFLDVGLMSRATRISIETLLKGDLILLNRGAFAEQFVGQELISYAPSDEMPELYYWSRDIPHSTAEIDYLLQYNDKIIPVEVKAGKTGTLKSMRIFMEEKKKSTNIPLGIKVSQNHLEYHENILTIPLYLLSEWRRLLSETIA